jgi:hypothetical protein
MIRATILKNGGLKITADNEGRRDLKEAFAFPPWGCADDLVAESLGGEFQFVRPEWVAALTSAPIITNELSFPDQDDGGYPDYVGDVWWFPGYMLDDPWELLKNTGRVFFEPEENNKSLGGGK